MRPIPDITAAELAAMPLTCDTCSAVTGELWLFLHDGFTVTARDAGGTPLIAKADAGEWGACEECAAAIVQRDLETLTALAMRLDPPKSQNARDAVAALQKAFLAHVRPGTMRRATHRGDMRVGLT